MMNADGVKTLTTDALNKLATVDAGHSDRLTALLKTMVRRGVRVRRH